jgi:hypothetical protein
MKKTSRKIMTGLMTSVLAVSLAVPAFASGLPLSDIAGHSDKNAILKLNYAGIIKGYEDGTFKPEKQVTRAEFAKMAVLSMGYTEEQAKLFAGSTKFSDVAADSWATGYINLAVANNIMKGDTAGTFRPADHVTIAESLTVFVRGLKIEITQPEGQWYLNYLLEATKLGLYDAGEGATAKAERGTIAKFASKFMEIPTYANGAYYDKDGNSQGNVKKLSVQQGVVAAYDADAKTIQLAGQDEASAITVDAAVYGGIVVGSSVELIVKNGKVAFINLLTDSSKIVEGVVKTDLDITTAVGDEDQFKAVVNGQEVVLQVVNGLAIGSSQIGKKFVAVKDATGKIESITFFANEVTGSVDKTSVVTGTNAKREIKVSGKTYKLTSNADVTGKAHPAAAAVEGSFGDIAQNDQVKLALNVDGEVTAIEFTKLSATGDITVNSAEREISVGGVVYSVTTSTDLIVNGEQKRELSSLSNATSILTFDAKGNLIKVEQGAVAGLTNEYVAETVGYVSQGTVAPKLTIDGKVYTITASVVKVDGSEVSAADIADDQLNDYKVVTLKYNVGTSNIVELEVEKVTVSGFVTAKTDSSVTVNGTAYTLAAGVSVDADAATNDKEYTLTLNEEGKVKAISGAVKTVSGVVEEVAVVKQNGVVTSANVTINGDEYTGVDAAALFGLEQFEYATLMLKRDGQVTSSLSQGTLAGDSVAFKGITTLIDGSKEVYFTNNTTKLALTSDFAVKYYNGSDMKASNIQTTDKVDLYTNVDGNVYLIVVEQR